MLKVFLVEDETIIREGLRDIIPWQQYGYTLVGDAGDGEQALPMIRELRPDVLITDIRMPFMDGLALSSLVSREFPATKIIIISGYDDFEYARQAIRIGVEQYLLKPITKTMLAKTLNEVQEKIRSEREQEDYMDKYRAEMQEYEQFSRRRFLEQIVTGRLSVEEIYEKAAQMELSLHAQSYNLLLYSIREKRGAQTAGATAGELQEAEDGLTQFFGMYPEYLMFRWNLLTWAVLVKSSRDQRKELEDRCIETIRMHVLPMEDHVEWHVAVGKGTERLSGLPACFEEVSHIFSCRHLMSGQHILTPENMRGFTENDDESSLRNVDMTKLDPAILNGFFENGQIEEVEGFAAEYLGSMRDAVGSRLFCQYLMLNVRFAAIAFLESLGYEQAEFVSEFPGVQLVGQSVSAEELKTYVSTILTKALELRERRSKSQTRTLVREALKYIDRTFADETISLKEVAGHINVSANYFSAVFSQEMEQTFVEYLTQKRMECAKELLRGSDLRTAEIAARVGYRDPHYFSFVFRRTQGVTPRDYRTGGRRK